MKEDKKLIYNCFSQLTFDFNKFKAKFNVELIEVKDKGE